MLMAFSVTASANSLESIAIMRNYEAKMNVSVTIEKPLDFLKEIPGIEEVYNYVELDALIESLVGSTIDMDIAGNISEDFSEFQVKVLMSSRTPLVINQNAKITTEFIAGIWIDADFTDAENLKFDMIVQAPFFNKYLVIDAIELLKKDEESLITVIETMKKTLNNETLAVMSSEAVNIIKKNATVSSGNNTLNVIFDKDGANQYIKDTIQWAVKQSLTEMDESLSAEYEEAINETLNALGEFSIFGDEGLKYQYVFDRSGNLKSATGTTHIDLDLYPFLELALFDTEGLNKDECHFAFKVTETAKYSNVGRTIVELPILTEENSMTIKDLMGEAYEPDYDYEEYEDFPPYFPSVEGEWANRTESGVLYAGLRGFLENIDQHHYIEESEVNHFEYDYNNGVLTVKNIGCTYLDFKEIVMTAGENKVLIDGTEILLDNPVAEINDRIFLGLDFYEKAFNYKPGYASHEIFEDTYYIQFELNEEF